MTLWRDNSEPGPEDGSSPPRRIFTEIDPDTGHVILRPPPLPKDQTKIVESWQFRFGVAMIALAALGVLARLFLWR